MTLRNVAASILFISILLLAGCIAPYYSQRRELVIEQGRPDSDRQPTFRVEMSQIPDGWLHEQDMQSYAWGQQITLKFDPAHPVRIIIVPDEQGGSPRNLSQSALSTRPK